MAFEESATICGEIVLVEISTKDRGTSLFSREEVNTSGHAEKSKYPI